jgi:hypothetical protein
MRRCNCVPLGTISFLTGRILFYSILITLFYKYYCNKFKDVF